MEELLHNKIQRVWHEALLLLLKSLLQGIQLSKQMLSCAAISQTMLPWVPCIISKVLRSSGGRQIL
jgi:hypothetical protein